MYKALLPEYLLIVGGPDVVPFVPLKNPLLCTRWR